MKQIFAIIMLALLTSQGTMAQKKSSSKKRTYTSRSAAKPRESAPLAELKTLITSYIEDYPAEGYGAKHKFGVDRIDLDTAQRRVCIYANEGFAHQHFSPAKVAAIYSDVDTLIQRTYPGYGARIWAYKVPLEAYITMGEANDSLLGAPMTWSETYEGHPWVRNTSIPQQAQRPSLYGRHMSVYQSHGRYYDQEKGLWKWQRPYLWCTTEDLLTQSFVIPYLVPMLENAGANVYTARERDWQPLEVIVDNDTPGKGGTYREVTGKLEWYTENVGFAHTKETYRTFENPFRDGTSRWTATRQDGQQLSRIEWTPRIQKAGRYAVYVSYRTDAQSVSDAHYTVVHRGIATDFEVNQQMGGGTWVYLGTFDFGEGEGKDNCVMLTNDSQQKGIISGDAVRFGGGMGNIERGPSGGHLTTSGMPRYLEGSRYNLQWSGMPDSVYTRFKNKHDYKDDYTSRPYVTNFLAGGSIFNKVEKGLGVPIETTIGIHSDAGYHREDSLIGTLGIITHEKDGCLRFPTGVSRWTSRSLMDTIMQQIESDMKAEYGRWNTRDLYNKSYAETRTPNMPAVIVEMFSHQNLADMRLAHDPTFKFIMSRAIYKGVARYNAYMHGKKGEVAIQPLPVSHMQAIADAETGSITLKWQPQEDAQEPAAKPTGYIVYQSIGRKGYDNGTYVTDTQYTIANAQPQEVYRLKVVACNEGGKSLESEEVVARIGRRGQKAILVVNGFQRLAAPYSFDTGEKCGFDLTVDPGVAYIRTPEYCGPQTGFDPCRIGGEDPGDLGYSSHEYEAQMMAGNTFDYPTQHVEDLMRHGDAKYTISSCSREALENGSVTTSPYHLLDIIMGAQREDGYTRRPYRIFTPSMQTAIRNFAQQGKAILISGAYLGSDLRSDEEIAFAREVLHYNYMGQMPGHGELSVTGARRDSYKLTMKPNAERYHTGTMDVILPTEDAASTHIYENDLLMSASVHFKGSYTCECFGFPLELISDAKLRAQLLSTTIKKLLNNQGGK